MKANPEAPVQPILSHRVQRQTGLAEEREELSLYP